jgi:hypothetical protein
MTNRPAFPGPAPATLDSGPFEVGADDASTPTPTRSPPTDIEETKLALDPASVPDFVLDADGSVPTWGEATHRFRARLRADSPHTPRFSPQWAETAWGKLLDADHDARQWAENTVLLTLTARSELPGTDQAIPPLRHLEGLMASDGAVRTALSQALSDADTWRRLSVFGVNESGHLHRHLGIYVSEAVDTHRFEPVVSSHVNNSPLAEPAAHGSGAVRIRSGVASDEPTGLVGYLGLNVPGLDTRDENPPGVLSEPPARMRGATVLEAGRQDAFSR